MNDTQVTAGIITGFGINADVELGTAFELAGANVRFFHITDLLENPLLLEQIDILGFPGGFSFGDHLGSGRVFAQLVQKNLKKALDLFVSKGNLVIGICNGFQVLVKMGFLPNLQGTWDQETTLMTNESGQFQDEWISVKYNTKSNSPWITGLTQSDLPIRHGEGRFIPKDNDVLQHLIKRQLIALTYLGRNPNGSVEDIAGITDPTGRILGLMPHPEAFTHRLQHPQWRRKAQVGELGLKLFQNAVETVRRRKEPLEQSQHT